MTTRVVCQSCGQEQEIEAGQGAKEGFREFVCQQCGFRQYVYIMFVTKVVPRL